MKKFDKDLDYITIIANGIYIAEVISRAMWNTIMDERAAEKGTKDKADNLFDENFEAEILGKWCNKKTIEVAAKALEAQSFKVEYDCFDDEMVSYISVSYKDYSFKISW